MLSKMAWWCYVCSFAEKFNETAHKKKWIFHVRTIDVNTNSVSRGKWEENTSNCIGFQKTLIMHCLTAAAAAAARTAAVIHNLCTLNFATCRFALNRALILRRGRAKKSKYSNRWLFSRLVKSLYLLSKIRYLELCFVIHYHSVWKL